MAGSANNKQPGTTNKRQKELARAKHERQTARRLEADRAERRKKAIWGSLAVMLGLIGLISWMMWPDSGSNVAETPDPAASASANPSGTPSDSPSSTTAKQVEGCTTAPTARENNLQWDKAPATNVKAGEKYTMTMKTNCGDIVVELAGDKAPATVSSFRFLAGEKYFDKTLCHRLTTDGIFVLQCGDPAGNGTGGPGYKFADENLPKAGDGNYPAGTVAMANSGPGTNGSQFFIVYKATSLPPNYTIWGTVTKGLDRVVAVAGAGVEGGGTDGKPAQPIGFESVTITPPLAG